MTILFDFLWPTATALVNMRRSAAEHVVGLSPSDREVALREKFAANEFPRAGLAAGWINVPWENQLQTFAQITLVNVLAIYEGWLEDLVEEIDPSGSKLGSRKTLVTSLQFYNSPNKDWVWAYSRFATFASPDFELAFGAGIRKSLNVEEKHIEPLLKCYRYFKEIRNALIHRNGRAHQNLVDAQTAYASVATRHSMGLKVLPKDANNTLAIGDDVKLTVYGVAAFNDVCLRLMKFTDMKAGLTTFGEDAFIRKINGVEITKSRAGRRSDTLKRLANSIKFTTNDTEAFERILQRKGVVLP